MYELSIVRSAGKGIRGIPGEVAERVISKIQELKKNPIPAGCRKIVGSENDYRIRVGNYRVVYELDKAHNRITIMAIGHRKDIYRNM